MQTETKLLTISEVAAYLSIKEKPSTPKLKLAKFFITASGVLFYPLIR